MVFLSGSSKVVSKARMMLEMLPSLRMMPKVFSRPSLMLNMFLRMKLKMFAMPRMMLKTILK